MAQTADARRRQRVAPTKGDLRERAILDAAEHQLASDGLEGMTVETIARAAGITRGALYFYFSSKNDVLTALVARTVKTLRADVDAADAASHADPAEALREGIRHTARMWTEHGNVMRAAVELSPTVPAIDDAWRTAVMALCSTTRRIAERAGITDGPGPDGSGAIATSLVWMTERTFYQTTVTGGSLDDAATTLSHIWLTTLGLHT